jgi:hypothetical protein
MSDTVRSVSGSSVPAASARRIRTYNPPVNSRKAQCISRGKNQGADDSCSAFAVSLPSDADLARVMNVWQMLPPAVRAGIVAMVNPTTPAEK